MSSGDDRVHRARARHGRAIENHFGIFKIAAALLTIALNVRERAVGSGLTSVESFGSARLGNVAAHILPLRVESFARDDSVARTGISVRFDRVAELSLSTSAMTETVHSLR